MASLSDTAQIFATQILQSISGLMKNTLNPSSKGGNMITTTYYTEDLPMFKTKACPNLLGISSLWEICIKAFSGFQSEVDTPFCFTLPFSLPHDSRPSGQTGFLKLCKQSSCQTSLARAHCVQTGGQAQLCFMKCSLN